VYFIHFKFANNFIKIVYFVILIVYPTITLLTNCIIAKNIRRHILKDQDENPMNAEYLDFEDDEEDILRKAKVLTVKRRLYL
jgi:signal transduction histidine kinase